MNRPNLTLVSSHRTPNKLDWATVEQALAANGNSDESRPIKFQRLVLERLLNVPAHEADEYITDGGDDCGVDCFVIDHNNSNIHIISTKTVDAYTKARKNFPGTEVTKLICFVRDFVGHVENLLARCNPLLRAKVIEAWDAISAGRVFQICVHVCSNQCQLIDRDFRSLREAMGEIKVSAFEHPLSRLSDEVSRNWAPPTSKSLRFIGRELFEHAEADADTDLATCSLMGSVKIAELYDFLKDDRTGFIDESLFHANVRGHPGIQNPVNREIAATLRSQNNNRFFSLNNGITVVCEKYLYQSGGFPVTLHRPQIVNGRQTVETIFATHKEDPARTADVVAFVRVIQTSDPSLIEEISIATNSQSRIGSRDLRANSAIAKKLAAGLERLGYCYIRKRGETSPLPPDRSIDALRAGQLILAYVRNQPEKAKTNTASMFGDEFETVFDPNHITPELLICAHRIFTDIEQEKHRAMLGMRQSGLSAVSTEHWLVEGSFHVLYCVALLAKKNNVELSDYKGCSGFTSEAMDAVGNYYRSAERVAAYRLFRAVKARDDLRAAIGGAAQTMAPQTRQLQLLLE